jgi:DNA-nicking Smr family endonuclease
MQQRTKLGIPVLNTDDDLYEIFTGEKSEIEQSQEETEENFAELFEQSLSDINNFQTILKEKETTKKSLSIEEKLKQYPLPEINIDLHGYTAKKAQKKTETFIRNAKYNAIKTVRIIVGKGIHSKGKAVLPDIVEKKVVELKQMGVVLTFHWEKRRKLKSGAMIVYLV